MATSVGQIDFGVGVDASRFTTELRAALAPALARIQQQLDRKPLRVPLRIDTAAAVNAAKIALSKADLRVTAKVDIDAQATNLAALREIRALNDKAVKVKVELDMSDADLARLQSVGPAVRAINALGDRSAKIKVDLDVSQDQLQRLQDIAPALRSLRGLTDKDVHVKIDVDVDEAKLARVTAALSALPRSQTIKVNVDTDTDRAGASVSHFHESLLGIAGTAARASIAIAGVTAAVGALGGAAGVAAGAVGGLAIGLAAIGPAAAAIGATAVVGFQGIGDAFSALKDVTANAAADARTKSDSVASAQHALAGAADSAESAQRSLADAQRQSADAAKDVADAYKTAQQRLDDYQTTLKGASLDEREARLNLAEAQQELVKSSQSTDPLARQRALLGVERAQLNLEKSTKANTDLQKKANEELAKGVDQSTEVVAARKKQEQADRGVADAQRNLAKSNAAVAEAAANLSKAQSAAGASSQKFSDALAQLSPNAAAFVLAVGAAQPRLEAFRRAVQDVAFAGLGEEFSKTATIVLPAFQQGMESVGRELNAAAKSAFEFIRSDEGIRGLNATFAAGAGFVRGYRTNLTDLTTGVTDFAVAAAPRMEEVGKAVAGIGAGFGRALSSLAQTGQLDQLFAGFSQVLTAVGPLLQNVLEAFGTLGTKVLPALAPLFVTLGETIKAIAPSLGDLGAVFAESVRSILPGLGTLISALAKGLQPVLPVLAQLIGTVAEALTPLIPQFSQFTVILGNILTSTLKALEPALQPLAEAFVSLLNAITPLIPLIAEGLAIAIQALAPALTTVLTALAPVIQTFAEEMKPVLEELAPVLADVAITLGQALADAIVQIAPLLPDLIRSWGDMVTAITPLLPALVDLAVTALPPLITVLGDFIRIVTLAQDALAALFRDVITPVTIPGLEALRGIWEDVFNGFTKTTDIFLDTVPDGIGKALGKIERLFSETVDAIGPKWGTLADLAAVPINFVIEQVWNNGLLKAWGSIDALLGGVLPDATPLASIPRRATGGPMTAVSGPGNGTKDDILTWLSNGEHVVTAAEVVRAGGQNVLAAIRDMIFRGIPFTWDDGKIITDLGKDNLSAYGAQVSIKGVGNVAPEGLFDQLLPRLADGGAVKGVIAPWMRQLLKGHDFARAQHGKPYQWAGPRFVGDSFDCSGFMASIAAAILGLNPWQRYWSTSSFGRGQRAVGPQGFTAGTDAGFVIGVNDDPGGPGGGHTFGVLGALPDLGIGTAQRVESGGNRGDVHYGSGPDPRSALGVYHLPIGANGFFEPGIGGTSSGPSPAEQTGFLSKTVERIVHGLDDPLRNLIKTAVGQPPPLNRAIPLAALNATETAFISTAGRSVGNLGGALGGVWQHATDLGDKILDFALHPFDAGGVATGTGFMAKDVISPERVLSPEQTALFEALVVALQKLATSGFSATAQAAGKVVVDISEASIGALRTTLGVPEKTDKTATPNADVIAFQQRVDAAFTQTGELISDTIAEVQRTQSSTAEVQATVAKQQLDILLSVAGKLSGEVLGPVMSSAVNAGIGILNKWIEGLSKDVVTAINNTTRAVNNVGLGASTAAGGTAPPVFGAPGSAFDATKAVSDAVVSVSSAATAAFKKVGDEIVSAALKQTASKVGNQSRGKLGENDISGGFLVDFIVKLTGVDIEILDTLENTFKEIQAFREGSFTGFDENGQLISDTAALVQRNQSSIELAAAEQERIQKALIKAVIKYLIMNVLIPIITAILGAMITLATTAIGAAIGSAIPVIGTAIGAAVGAAVGVALTGLAVVFTSLLAVGAGAALDAFDEGGVASGLGLMPKNTIAPERVLSPRQTTSFEKLVQILDGGQSGNRTVQIGSMNVNGRDPAQRTADDLLRLLNT